MKYLEADISNAQLHTGEDWIYMIANLNKQEIVYLGSTSIHPVAQLEKHITNGLLESENRELKLFAFPLPEFLDRKLVKKLLIDEFDSTEIGEEFEGMKLDSKVWREHVEYAKKLIKKIREMLS
ncbi:hypothetical protein [Oceanobacillus salinisoli]|uniref:hypothetical protein n=1 Tax=Oceanobacillus salinisoli TaxID=2678611 RepID=UPI0012E141DA|nr:hypothetical protein [Oceanobacillus salinisoli]